MKRDKNKELMMAAGSKNGAYDPESPDQLLWAMDHSPDPRERGLAWIKSKSIHFPHDSPFCVDANGKPLYLEHMAADLGWKPQTARNVLQELQSQGRIRVEDKRIWYCATIPRTGKTLKPPTTSGSDNSVQSYFPPYVVDFINSLPEKTRPGHFATLTACGEWRREFMADGMANLRSIADQVEDNTLAEIGIPKKHLPKRRDTNSKWVQLNLKANPEFVQTPLCTNSEPVRTNPETIPYKVKAAAVSLLPFKQETETTPPPPTSSSRTPGKKAEEEDSRSLYQIFKTGYPAAHFDEPKSKPAFERKTRDQQCAIIERLGVYKESDRWKSDEGRWIPLASTWLKSYEADPPPAIQKKGAATAGDWNEMNDVIEKAKQAEKSKKGAA